MARTLMAAILLFGVACTSPTDPTGSLKVLPRDGSLRLENVADHRTFYFIYEAEGAALINWAACVDPSLCPSLVPHGETIVPYTAIGGYAPGKTEAIVWWWVAVPGPADEAIPGRIHNVMIRL